MRISGLIIRTVVLCMLLSAPAFSANIFIDNFGFENGLDGWTVAVDYRSGTSATFDGGENQPYANVVASHAGYPSGSTTYNPKEGNFFLELNTGTSTSDVVAAGVFTSFSASAGQTLSGYAAFDAGVGLSRLSTMEFAQAIIESDDLYDVVYSEDVLMIGGNGEGQWTKWTWTAPSTGNFTLFYLLTNPRAGDNTSYAMFDAVPIPASLFIFGSGLIGLIGLRRRYR